ncbi:HU family DNA-binding protein [Candidatus Synchoanobacter obligatus]|uniref:HU family DNA-binding protein n=1 Tax=Candidatus Synchoanobacter obligatus TaxID=2919597 RepID=A0ABT1L3T2_9GAMM|nr:HU family DNA-binding protein [Candidatus Synchoanobacter obligatus]MCP8351854.1 HU family DNA-binding protein [Candidatus Synchoanobacter obligatus]
MEQFIGKSQFLKKVSQDLGCSLKEAESFYEAFKSNFLTYIQAGEDIRLPGFITAHVGERAARTGRNPRTGETLHIPAKKVVKLKAGKELKDSAEAS